MLIDSSNNNQLIVVGSQQQQQHSDQVKLTPIDPSQMMQINQIMDEMHHSIKETNGNNSTNQNGGVGAVHTIMLNGQPALFIPASAFNTGPTSNMDDERGNNNGGDNIKQQNGGGGGESISMSLDFTALLGGGGSGSGNDNHHHNQLNTSKDQIKYEPIEYEDDEMVGQGGGDLQQQHQSNEGLVGSQFSNLTNIINNNNTSQQQQQSSQSFSAGNQQGVTLYQLPNGTLTTDPAHAAAMMANETTVNGNAQQTQYLYLPMSFDGNMGGQTAMQNTQQVFMTSNGQLMTSNQQQHQQVVAVDPKSDQNEYLLSGKKKSSRTGNTIAMALKSNVPLTAAAASTESAGGDKKRSNKKNKFTMDSVVEFKMNKLSTIISQKEKIQEQQQNQQQQPPKQQQIVAAPVTVPASIPAPIVISAPSVQPQQQQQPQFQLLQPGQQVFCDPQTNQWYLVNAGQMFGNTCSDNIKPTAVEPEATKSPKERQIKPAARQHTDGETDDELDDIDDDEDDDFSDNENNTKRDHRKRRRACDCSNCLKLKQFPGREAGKKRTHVCHKCPKEYNKTSHLRAHLRAHDGLRPYACDFRSCGKSFTRSDELKRHKRIHTDDRKFACTVCKKRFLRSDHLGKHMLIHMRNSKDLPLVLETLKKTSAEAAAAMEKQKKQASAQVKIKTLLQADEENKKNNHQQHDQTTAAITLPNGTTAFITAMSASIFA